MKIIAFLVGSLVSALGGLPPLYLTVENHQLCMGEKSMGSWTAVCLHNDQPENCPDAAFEALHKLQMFKGSDDYIC